MEWAGVYLHITADAAIRPIAEPVTGLPEGVEVDQKLHLSLFNDIKTAAAGSVEFGRIRQRLGSQVPGKVRGTVTVVGVALIGGAYGDSIPLLAGRLE